MNAKTLKISTEIALLPDPPPYDERVLAAHGIRGLQCGSGLNLARGWLNSDAMRLAGPSGVATAPHRLARVGGAFYMEADNAARFPIADAAFEWIYSEHFIEHLDTRAAVGWLREMRRLLKPGGLLRISTPDLRLFAKGYADPSNGFLRKHRESLLAMGLKDVPERPAWLINQIFMHYGHRWIYDFDEISLAIAAAGFPKDAITECRFHEGRAPEVAGLDREARRDHSFYVEVVAR